VPPNKAAQVVAESAQKEQPAPFKQYDTDAQVAAFMAMQNAATGGTVDTCCRHAKRPRFFPRFMQQMNHLHRCSGSVDLHK
jgi:hypothetical protein